MRFVCVPEFFDLENDPYELNNLIDDPAYRKKIDDMDSALKEWMSEQGDTGASMDKPFRRK